MAKTTLQRVIDDNRRLDKTMEASPALLRALKAIVAAWESVPEDQQVPEVLNVDRLWADAHKAIRRAEGE